MVVLELTKKNFERETKKGIVLVDFWASWCSPCMMLKPIFKELSDEIRGLKFCSVDTQANGELAMNYHITGIPCIVAFKEGREIDRIIGLMPRDELKKAIEEIKKR
ncbi:MAG: thioredoxin [Nanoarchaeota archaeon]